jgi:cytochrome oxidase assembly protein ShyY1
VLRTAFRPRWLALLVLVLLAATAMSLLGQWQLDRARSQSGTAQREAERARAAQAPVELASVLAARQTFPAAAVGRSVLVTGRWDGARQVLVPDRAQDGRTGFWLLTPLRRDDGSGVPVVRGWVPTADDPAVAAPSGSGPVQLTGTLHPAEPPADREPGQGTGLPAGQLAAVSVVDLLDRWPYPLITGYLLLTGQQPPGAGSAPAPAQLPAGEPGLALRNLSYAVQWWLFAAFGLFFWYRLVRDDHRGRLTGTVGPTLDDTRPVPAGRIGEDDPP